MYWPMWFWSDGETRGDEMDEICYINVVDCLAEINASLDYELSPSPGRDRWEWQIKRLYQARDKVLTELKKYRR